MLSSFITFRTSFAFTLLPHFWQNMYFVAFCSILSDSTCIVSHFVYFFTFHHISHAFCRILYDFAWNLYWPFYRTSDKTCILSHFVWFDNISLVFCGKNAYCWTNSRSMDKTYKCLQNATKCMNTQKCGSRMNAKSTWMLDNHENVDRIFKITQNITKTYKMWRKYTQNYVKCDNTHVFAEVR